MVLPTDLEWSLLAGLSHEKGNWPAHRELQEIDQFPWGQEWPPPVKSGNLADTSAKLNPRRKIPNYQDGYGATSPVGSFPATYQESNLKTTARSAVTPTYRNDIYGFRVVMDKTDPPSGEVQEEFDQ